MPLIFIVPAPALSVVFRLIEPFLVKDILFTPCHCKSKMLPVEIDEALLIKQVDIASFVLRWIFTPWLQPPSLTYPYPDVLGNK